MRIHLQSASALVVSVALALTTASCGRTLGIGDGKLDAAKVFRAVSIASALRAGNHVAACDLVVGAATGEPESDLLRTLCAELAGSSPATAASSAHPFAAAPPSSCIDLCTAAAAVCGATR